MLRAAGRRQRCRRRAPSIPRERARQVGARYGRAEERAAAPCGWSSIAICCRRAALDVACGGLAALWLAPGLAVDAVDVAFAGLARLAAAAARGLVVQTDPGEPRGVSAALRYAVVVSCRYPERTLFPALRAPSTGRRDRLRDLPARAGRSWSSAQSRPSCSRPASCAPSSRRSACWWMRKDASRRTAPPAISRG